MKKRQRNRRKKKGKSGSAGALSLEQKDVLHDDCDSQPRLPKSSQPEKKPQPLQSQDPRPRSPPKTPPASTSQIVDASDGETESEVDYDKMLVVLNKSMKYLSRTVTEHTPRPILDSDEEDELDQTGYGPDDLPLWLCPELNDDPEPSIGASSDDDDVRQALYV